MKSAIVLFLMLFFNNAFAGPIALQDRDVSIEPIAAASIEVTSEKVACGPACDAIVPVVKMLYNLKGCADRVVSFSKVEVNGDEATVYVTALNIASQYSSEVKCFAIATQVESVALPATFSEDNVKVVFLGVDK